MAERILDMENLHVSFDTYAGEVKAVRGVTLHVDEGEVLAILEEADSKMTGVIIEDNGKLMFRADSMSKTPIQIQRKDSVIYHEGEKVLAEVVYRGQRHAEHKVKIVFSFGVCTRASVCAEAMVAVRGVNVDFPEEVVAEADQLANAPIPQEEYAKRLGNPDLHH